MFHPVQSSAVGGVNLIQQLICPALALLGILARMELCYHYLVCTFLVLLSTIYCTQFSPVRVSQAVSFFI